MSMYLDPGIWIVIPFIFVVKTVMIYMLVLAFLKKVEDSPVDEDENNDSMSQEEEEEEEEEELMLSISDDEDLDGIEDAERMLIDQAELAVGKENELLPIVFPAVIFSVFFLTTLLLLPMSYCSKVQIDDCRSVCNSTMLFKVFGSSYSAVQCCSCEEFKGFGRNVNVEISPPPAAEHSDFFCKSILLSKLVHCSNVNFSLPYEEEIHETASGTEVPIVKNWDNFFSLDDVALTADIKFDLVFDNIPTKGIMNNEDLLEVSNIDNNRMAITEKYFISSTISIGSTSPNGSIMSSLISGKKFAIIKVVIFATLFPVLFILLVWNVITCLKKLLNVYPVQSDDDEELEYVE